MEDIIFHSKYANVKSTITRVFIHSVGIEIINVSTMSLFHLFRRRLRLGDNSGTFICRNGAYIRRGEELRYANDRVDKDGKVFRDAPSG